MLPEHSQRPEQQDAGPGRVNRHRPALLGEFRAVGLGDQRKVRIVRLRQVERPLQQDLPWCVVQEVGATNDLGDSLARVIHDDSQLVGKEAILSTNNEVSD
jgi:hypothetical protein